MQNRTLTPRFLLVAGLMLIVGCDTTAPTPVGWSDPIPPKENRVTFVTLDHDVLFASGAKTMAADQAADLSKFLTSNTVGEGDTVTVDSSSGRASLAAARQAAVLAELNRLHVHAVLASGTTSSADSVRIHVGHTIVTTPRCPDWSKPEADNPANSPSSNFGCATEASLAQMVANPADLVRGRSNDKADGAVLARGAELYRSGGLAKTLSGNSGYSTSGLSGTSGSASSGSGVGGSGGGGGSQ